MRPSLALILFLAALFALSRGAGAIWGDHGRFAFLGILVVAYIGSSIWLKRRTRRLQAEFDSASDEEKAALKEHLGPDLLDQLTGRPNPIAKAKKRLDLFFAFPSMALPPLLYHFARGLDFSMDAEITLPHILLMGAGLGTYLLARHRYIKRLSSKTQ